MLEKAQSAKNNSIEAEGLERIQLAVMSSRNKNGINTTLLAKNLSEINGLTDTNDEAITEITLPKRIKLNSFKYIIKKDGTVDIYTPRLPVEYQEVEYIESTGTQYILTGITYEINFEINCDFQLTELKNDYQTMMGQNTCDIRIDSNGYLRGITELPYVGLTKHICKIVASSNNNQRTVILDGETYSFTHSYIANEQCAIFTNGSNIENRKIKAKFYSGNIYLNNELIANYVPCYRKSDNKPGVYDTVKGNFYTNQGSGDDFIIGPEI